MLNVSTVQNDILTKLNAFEREVQEVYTTLVLPHWGGELHGFPYTLYGYMMTCFAHIDLFSAFWRGNDNKQTERMIAFMEKYISPNREANSLAVQVWRHKLRYHIKGCVMVYNENVLNLSSPGLGAFQLGAITHAMRNEMVRRISGRK